MAYTCAPFVSPPHLYLNSAQASNHCTPTLDRHTHIDISELFKKWSKMGRRLCSLSVVASAVICCSLVASAASSLQVLEETKVKGDKSFLLQKSKQVIKTDAGNMRVVKGLGGKLVMNPMHIGFITMEPRSLFIPQYLDSSLILLVNRGEAKVGHIHKDELVEKRMKNGDIYRIAPGSAFYIINTSKKQKLHVICSIGTSESLGSNTVQSFFLAGGSYPVSVLSGFDHSTLSTAFNVSKGKLHKMFSKQEEGPIIFLSSDSHSSNGWSKFVDMDQHKKLSHMKRIASIWGKDRVEEKEEEKPTLFFRKFLNSVFGEVDVRSETPDTYNIFDADPDFKNDYGWTLALDETKYSPLAHDDIGLYLVELKKGSMMAPHVNPRATEYGIVLKGSGTIQIVHPNGTLAMKAKVSQGDVFWVPRYFPFCQIASSSRPFEFFGFTTSARNNRAQFLVGANSVLHTMSNPEFAAAFGGVSKDKIKHIIDAQKESVILPTSEKDASDEMEAKLRSFGDNTWH